VAENTVDAVVAPACWAAVGGPAGAGAYRAVNTLDAMVGHRCPRYARFGWASARLDDAANWVPARLTAVLVAAVRPGAAAEIAGILRHPPDHPSPNAGVAEAAFAAALGLRLGGDTVYAGRVDPRPALGTGRPPEPADIEAAVRLSAHVSYALAGGLGGVGLLARRTPEARGRPPKRRPWR
jgi:adenosylcobinamide-phosphate synthase